jgi:glycerophosphoryl diester phosphodiesterase
MSEMLQNPVLEMAPEEIKNPGVFQRTVEKGAHYAGHLVLAGSVIASGFAYNELTNPESASAQVEATPWEPNRQDCLEIDRYAHRGEVRKPDSKGPNENTPGSAKLAYELRSATGDETDWYPIKPAHRGQPGKWRKMHNKTVDATTNGHGAITQMTPKQVRKLRTADGSHVTGLISAARLLARYPREEGMWEQKPAGKSTDPEKRNFLKVIYRFGLQDRMTLSSFSLPILKGYHSISRQMYPNKEQPEVARIYGPSKGAPNVHEVPKFLDWINLVDASELRDDDWIKKAHNAGFKVSVGVDTESQFNKVIRRAKSLADLPDRMVSDNTRKIFRLCLGLPRRVNVDPDPDPTDTPTPTPTPTETPSPTPTETPTSTPSETPTPTPTETPTPTDTPTLTPTDTPTSTP